jgi:hypothetical protein
VIGRALAVTRKGAGYLGRPGQLARKLAQAWRRRRSAAAYRERLERGDLLVVPPAPPAEILFTIATPVYRVAEEHLRAAIASVRTQTHAGWELVLVDDASPDPHVARVLADAARDDRRISVLRRATNGGIAAASDEALHAARGEYVAFLDHDDLLHPRALEIAARTIAADRSADWLFSDEDKIDEAGRHGEPCFKPAWSRHLLLAFNYVAHLRVVRRSLLQRLGGHRAGLEGAQDYDLALRALASGACFAHVPGVLYHWRTVPASMARLAQAKPLAHAHAVRALAEHARSWPRGGEVSSEVLLAPAGLFRVRRLADPSLRIAHIRSESGLAGGALIESVRRSDAEVVVVTSGDGLTSTGLTELLALLQVPRTAVVSGRCARRGVVLSSGWVATEAGKALDPWAGLAVTDPAYLNLALIPGRRALPAATAWAGWRDLLVSGWEAAPEVVPSWRLGVGLARLGVEVVVTPETTVPLAAAPAQVPPDPPAELPRYWTRWPGELRLGR